MSTNPLNAPCPVCDATVTPANGVMVSEIISCRECGSEIEVKGINPLELAEAPMEEEDWGE